MPTADSSSPEASDYAAKLKRITGYFDNAPTFDPSYVLKKSLLDYADVQVSPDIQVHIENETADAIKAMSRPLCMAGSAVAASNAARSMLKLSAASQALGVNAGPIFKDSYVTLPRVSTALQSVLSELLSQLSEELAYQLVEWLKIELAKKDPHNAEDQKGFTCRLAEFSAELPDRPIAEEKTEGFQAEGSGI